MSKIKMNRLNGWTTISADGTWQIQNAGQRSWSVLNIAIWNSDDCWDAEEAKQYFETYAQAKAWLETKIGMEN